MQSKYQIYIDTDNSAIKRIGDAGVFAMIMVAPIMLGWLIESTAMQWGGLLMGILLAIGVIMNSSSRKTFKTIDEAIEFLKDQKKDG